MLLRGARIGGPAQWGLIPQLQSPRFQARVVYFHSASREPVHDRFQMLDHGLFGGLFIVMLDRLQNAAVLRKGLCTDVLLNRQVCGTC